MAAASGITVQGRVIWALMLREVHTIYGGTYLGYLWVIINNAFGVAIFWAVRDFLGSRPPHGMSSPAFLIIGLCCWNVFNGVVSKSITAVSGNQALLTFPQVTPLDLMLARTFVLVATDILVAAILLSFSSAMNYQLGPVNWGGVLTTIFYLVTLSFSLGVFLATLCQFIKPLGKVIPMVMRIMFFCSGIFFSADQIPHVLREIFKWNPLLQVIEMGRNGLAQSYIVSVVDWPYLTIIIILLSFLGLLLERYSRAFLVQAG